MLQTTNSVVGSAIDNLEVEGFITASGLVQNEDVMAGVSGGLLSVSAAQRPGIIATFEQQLQTFFDAAPSALRTIEESHGLESGVLTSDFMASAEFHGAEFAGARIAGNSVGIIVAAGAAPDAFFATCLETKPFNETDDVSLLQPLVATGFANLSFSGPKGDNKAITADLLTESVTLAIRQSASSDLEALNFPTVLIPAGKPGVMFTFSDTFVVSLSKSVNSAAANQTVRTPINDATLDRSLLRCDTLALVPSADITDADDYLVAVGDYPNEDRKIVGTNVTVKTRPIKFGVTTNILELCNDTKLGLGEIDTTDELNAIASLGKVLVAITVADTGGGNAITKSVLVDTAGHPGYMFHPSVDGSSSEYKLNFDNVIEVSKKTEDITGATLASGLVLDTRTGIAADVSYGIELQLGVNAKADKDGNIKYNTSQCEVVSVNGEAITGYEITAVAVGYFPDMDRLNLNARSSGIRLQIGTTRSMIYPVRVKAPLVTVSPRTSAGSGLSATELTKALRLQRSNESTDVLLNTIEALRAESPVMKNCPAVRATLVKPTLVTTDLILGSTVISANTSEARKAVSAGIVNALAAQFKTMDLESGYNRGIIAQHGTSRGVRYNLTTSAWIASLIAESGEDKVFGPGVNYKIAIDNAVEFETTVITTKTRLAGAPNDMFSFGCYQMTPALVQDIDNQTASGANFMEKRMFRRDGHVIACPVAAELNIPDVKEILLKTPVLNAIA